MGFKGTMASFSLEDDIWQIQMVCKSPVLVCPYSWISQCEHSQPKQHFCENWGSQEPHLFKRSASNLWKYASDVSLMVHNLLSLNFHINSLSTCPSHRLVHHNPGIWHCEPPSLWASSKNNCCCWSSQAKTNGGHISSAELDGIENAHSRTARARNISSHVSFNKQHSDNNRWLWWCHQCGFWCCFISKLV